MINELSDNDETCLKMDVSRAETRNQETMTLPTWQVRGLLEMLAMLRELVEDATAETHAAEKEITDLLHELSEAVDENLQLRLGAVKVGNDVVKA